MKKQVFIVILLSIVSFTYGQYVGPSFVLNETIPPDETRSYLASEYIKLINNGPGQGGFHADPWPGHPVSLKIDPYLIFPPDEGETGGAGNNNTGGVVGTLPGGATVSPTGAANYSIPLNLPPGTAGMTPSLGLVYNSQGGNGLLGIGWSLSGLSAITRTGTTIYNDGYIDGVDFDDNDKLALDGQRLIPVENGSEYRTEIESFSKIIPNGSFSGMPEWFEVYTKDGRIIEYGHTDDSRIETSDNENVLMWLINRISDRKGNYIDFEYSENNGMGRIKKISYSGNMNTGQQPYYFVEFHYTTGRQDKILSFVAGSKIEISEILTDITVKYSTSTNYLQHYNLMYDWGTYTHLLKVTVDDWNGNHFNPTLFNWGEETLKFKFEYPYIHHDFKHIFGDYNGDGFTDYVRLPIEINELGDNYLDLFLNDKTGNFPTSVFHTLLPREYTYLYPFPQPGNLIQNSVDFNGDGLQDMILDAQVYLEYPDVDTTGYYRRLDIYYSSGDHFDMNAIFSIFLDLDDYVDSFTLGDYNGDGISDIFLLMNDRSWKIMVGTENNGFVINYGLQTINQEYNISNSGDYNGNGKSDIMFTSESGCDILEFTNTTYESLFKNDPPGYPTIWHTVYSADFNGDKITDVLTWEESHGWELHLFNGENFDWNNDYAPDLKSNIEENGIPPAKHRIADLNGDGKADIFELEDLDWNNDLCNINIFYCNGTSFIKENTSIHKHITFYPEQNIKAGDFNGDGKQDLTFLFRFDYKNKNIMYFHPDERKHFVEKITNGLGHETQITYKPLTDKNVYTKGDGASYPVVDIQPAFYVVDSILADNGIGSKAVTLYQYEGAKYHQQGKGFLGYEKTTAVNFPSTGRSTKTVNTYRFNDEYYFRWAEISKIFVDTDDDDNVLITESTNQAPFIKPYADKRIFFYTPASLTQVYHTGDDQSSYVKTILKTQNFEEGNDLTYGNVSFTGTYTHPEKLDLNNLPSEYDYSTVTDFVYNYNASAINAWLISRVTSATTKTKSKKDPTGTTDTQKITYIYDGNSPYIKEERNIPNNSTEMTTVSTYLYDDYGNITITTHAAHNFSPAPPDRVITYIYSNEFQHRFVTETDKTVDGINFTSKADYYPETGLIKSETDVNGLTTSYFYDGFGRLTKTVFPDQTQQQQVWRWSNGTGENPEHGLYKIWSQTTGEPPASVYYDQRGRELRTVTENFRKDFVYTDKEYNQFGRIARTSEPYYPGEEKLWTNYTYLVTGAVKTMVTPVNSVRYTYDGKIVTAFNETTGISTSKETDALGHVIKSTDPGGTIQYDYYSSGQPFTVKMGGNIITITYDKAGFQETLADPDAGISTYNYNPFGELVNQTDNRGNNYEMIYDALGRMTVKKLTNENHTTTYTYDTEENGLGLLSGVTGWNGIKTAYHYDGFSRVTEKTETINGEDYTFKYKYDAFGRLETETWPTGFAVSRKYKNGYLTRIRQTATDKPIWELTDITARGQVKQFELGNGLLTTKNYTPTGFLTDIETGNVQYLKYNFDEATGNLTWREDLSRGLNLHEDFTYDDKLKNRLETWKVFGQTLYAINYADNGNFNSKTDVGTGFEYGTGLGTLSGAGPHAVKRVNQPATAYLEMARNVQQIEYTGFNKTKKVTVTVNANNKPGGEGQESWSLDLVYGPDNYRRTTTLSHNHQVVKSKLFAGGNFEVETDAEGKQRKLHYISGGDGLCAIYVTDEDNPGGTMYYILKDHLGSMYAVTGENGEVVHYNGQQQVFSFDPWGRRRNPDSWTFNDVPDQYIFDRGFTGHEHLDELGLINMNGRMYDPWLGRFLSPDNYVQAPGYSQNLNRYSYALNNPLIYTDPDGQWVQYLIGAAIGGIVNVALNWNNIDNFGDGFAYFGIGAVAGAVAVGIGSGTGTLAAGSGSFGFNVPLGLTASGILPGGAAGGAMGFTAGFIMGVGNSLVQGNRFGSSLTTGLKWGGIGAAAGFAVGAISGGIRAGLLGNNLWTGNPPFVTITRPELNFTGLSNDYGWNYPSRYRTKLNSLPPINKLWSNYQKVGNGISSGDVYEKIGGDVYNLRLNNPIVYRNSCALRLSYAFNKSGYLLPKRISSVTGADGNNYYLTIKEFENYLSKSLGPADIIGTNPSEFVNQQGIILFKFNNGTYSNATGHITLFNGSNTAYGNYFGLSKVILLWKIHF